MFDKVLMYKLVYGSKFRCPINVSFRKVFYVEISSGGGILIGPNVFFNNYCSICSMDSIVIEEGTIFGENVKVYDHNHCYKDYSIPFKSSGYSSAPIHIGKHCWIGSNVTILKGVTIGDNCVIGAGCVIFKDVPSGSVVLNKQNLLYK